MRTPLASLLCGLLAASPFTRETIAQEPVPATAEARDLRRAADAAVEKHDWDAAAAAFRKLTEVSPKEARAWHMLGYCLHAAGKLDEALPVHEKAATFEEVAPVATYNIACVHALKGNKDKAFEWLGKAADLGFANVDHLAGDTDLDALRSDPRFEKLVAKIKAMPEKPARVVAYSTATERKAARLALFSRTGSPGQLVIDYGPVAWKDKYTEHLESAEFGKRRWRFGKDFWTSLDTNLDLELGGVKVPAGQYYLTLSRSKDGGILLGLHDAAEVRKQKLDAFLCDQLKGGLEVALKHTTREASKADQLEIAVAMQPDSLEQGELSVRFGPHELTAALVLKRGTSPL